MIIDRIHIAKFHGFKDVGFSLGKYITMIAGPNGTQKTTLLGLMSQAFTLSSDSEMSRERPLCGGSYRSMFSEKFKLSPKYDKPGEHEWTLSFLSGEEDYTVTSMYRDRSKGDDIRFWKKGERGKGTGYNHYPVIFLSLKRLIPLGEESSAKTKDEISFNDAEKKLFKELHNDILFSFDDIVETNVIETPNKTTLGISTEKYDWMQNSAGQDNVGKILLALLSFKRLQEKYKKSYKGGLLFIDELDATMYPGSQLKLLKKLLSYATRYQIQIVFTTHSLTLLKLGYELMQEAKENAETQNNIQLIYLEKKDDSIKIFDNFPYSAIENRLQHITSPRKKSPKVTIYTEDPEAVSMTKALLQGTGCLSKLEFSRHKFGCENLINLMQIGVEEFLFPKSIVVFDGDLRKKSSAINNLHKIKHKPNWVILPTDCSPEQVVMSYLYKLSDGDPLWELIDPDYNKLVCFSNHKPDLISTDRTVAKKWFQEQSCTYQGWLNKIVASWKKSDQGHAQAAKEFADKFLECFGNIADELRIQRPERRGKR